MRRYVRVTSLDETELSKEHKTHKVYLDECDKCQVERFFEQVERDAQLEYLVCKGALYEYHIYGESTPVAVEIRMFFFAQDDAFQGVVGMEDQLQLLVPETIKDYLRAGIKVWMLTGDKLEAAKNIGLACNLIDPDMQPQVCVSS